MLYSNVLLLSLSLSFLLLFSKFVFAMELQLSQPNAFTQLYGWKDDCSQKALEAVIPQCTRGVENISPEQQKLVAMELSICEFENNGIQYPLECYEEVRKIQIGGCIRALEKSPQFWTSFSGNYRNVKEVCHQVSLPYEKSQIIEVYENVTAIYQSLVRDLKASHSHSEQVQDQLEKKFAEIFSVIDSLLMDNMMRKEEMNSTFSQFHENFEATMNNALVIITNSYQGVNTNIQEMESHLNYFTSELRDITSLLSQQRNELNSQQEALIKNNQHLLFQQNELVAMAKIHAQDIHHSTQQHALSLHKQLQYSEFTLQSIDAILNQNVNGLYLQRTQIIEQTSYIMDHFAKSLSEYLNLSAQSSIWTFENTLQTSLENLETKINQTTESLAVMNATLYACTSFVVQSAKFFTNFHFKNASLEISAWIWRKLNFFHNGFTFIYKLLIVTILCILLITMRPFVNVFWLMATRVSSILVSMGLGIICAFICIKMGNAFLSGNG